MRISVNPQALGLTFLHHGSRIGSALPAFVPDPMAFASFGYPTFDPFL